MQWDWLCPLRPIPSVNREEVSFLKNFGSYGCPLLATTTTTDTVAWGLHRREQRKERRNKGGWAFHISSWALGVSFPTPSQDEPACSRALSVTWCPLLVHLVWAPAQSLGRWRREREKRKVNHHQLGSTSYFGLLQYTCFYLLFRVLRCLLCILCSNFVTK